MSLNLYIDSLKVEVENSQNSIKSISSETTAPLALKRIKSEEIIENRHVSKLNDFKEVNLDEYLLGRQSKFANSPSKKNIKKKNKGITLTVTV